MYGWAIAAALGVYMGLFYFIAPPYCTQDVITKYVEIPKIQQL